MPAQDECDSLGDVYVWGEVVFDTLVRTGSDTVISSTGKTDILLPKPLESNLVLDVYHVDCGAKHAALVMKNGEVFTWGEDSGGRLGHGTRGDCVRPRLVEFLTVSNVDFVACGEFHTCAVTTTGELYTWGDGTHNVGLLGHGNDLGHWIPKRISGALEGLQVAYVSCGTWHTALITSMGQLFTFGDGTFGVLGHGDQKSVSYPREVESLSGLETIAVACGVWHTAAVVNVIHPVRMGGASWAAQPTTSHRTIAADCYYSTSIHTVKQSCPPARQPNRVIVTRSSSSVKLSAGKLFTWGDGDMHRLGHGDKKTRLKPTCVATLIDHDFYSVACGHCLTVALATSGQVFSMGYPVYGQLGNPHSDGRIPCLVEDKIVGEQVIQIACGSYHVAVLTGRSEVFTWGKGTNGRLGHGDIDNRKVPTLVEALKDRAVRYIACGANFTAAICQHKWVSGADQSQCSSCRQPFGFTRRRRNCYNCGLVHCNACTSRKALRAALAPSPGKPYRVCDSCFLKLNNASGPNSAKVGNASLPINMDMIRNLAIKAAQQGKKTDELSFPQNPQRRSIELYSSPTSPQVMPLELLRKTTNDFSEKQRLGSGTFGAVYKGILDGKKVAVKLLHSMSHRLDYEEEFMKEFDNLRRLNHPNIVQLLGYCYEIKRVCVEHEGKYVLADEIYRALCFDYMHNGSLRRHLDEVNTLDWPTCYKIIKGTSKGLKYLHEGSETPMFHLDLKPENILLDKKMVPKIADFGLSKLVCDNQTKCTSSPLGTRRYCPPEYIEQGYVSNKFDIFSLGVVMIEIIAGPEGYRKAAEMPSQEFIAHVQGNWRERLEATPDCTSLIYECRQVQRCIEIALECVSADRKQRPNIGDITSWLHEIENNTKTLATTFTSQNET